MRSQGSTLNSIFAAAALFVLASGAARAGDTIDVVATFSILGDMVQQVGGDRINLSVLVGPDADGHVYQPTPADARTVAETSLLIVNGLGFEGWISRLIEASGYAGPVITATRGIEPLGSGNSIDPHAWQSLPNARVYVRNIADGLAEIDPDGAELYRSNAARYIEQINAADAKIRQLIASIPLDRRKVVTSHDAFGYFSTTYEMEFQAPVGVNTESEASAGDVAQLIRQINNEQIPAVFVENISDRRLLDQIVRETGATIGGTLYSDALSDSDGPAETFLGMMQHNVSVLVTALGD